MRKVGKQVAFHTSSKPQVLPAQDEDSRRTESKIWQSLDTTELYCRFPTSITYCERQK